MTALLVIVAGVVALRYMRSRATRVSVARWIDEAIEFDLRPPSDGLTAAELHSRSAVAP